MRSKYDQKTILRPAEDRTASLKNMLTVPMAKDEIVPVLREVSRLIILFDADLSTLPEMRNMLAVMQKLQMEFMEDTLRYRKLREEKAKQIAQAQSDTSDEWLSQTEQRLKALKLSGKTGVPLPPNATLKPSIWDWWRDRVFAPVLSNLLGWTITGIAGFITYGIFLAIKAAFKIP